MNPVPTTLDAADPAIATRELVKRYGGHTALAGIDLVVPRGAVYVLIGPNGAGKTTTLKVLLDLVRAQEGTAEVLGLDTVADAPRVRARVGWTPERQDVGYGWAPVRWLLRHHASYHPSWDEVYAGRLADALDVRLDRKFGKLSKGEARRVQLVMTLAHRPPVLLFDEPTDGLDPVMRDRVLELLTEHLAETPTTVLISTHHVHEMERQGDHVGILREGRLTAQLPREELRERLHRYEATVPAGWKGPGELEGAVLRRDGGPREIAWDVWGEEEEIARRLRASGAELRGVSALSLEEAALALLRAGEGRAGGRSAGAATGRARGAEAAGDRSLDVGEGGDER